MEFDTLVKQGVPVIIVISNDAAWGMIKSIECVFSPERVRKYEADNKFNLALNLTHVRYEKIAEMFDCYGEYVEDAEEIVPAINRALETGKPAIINVITEDPAKSISSPGTVRLASIFKIYDK